MIRKLDPLKYILFIFIALLTFSCREDTVEPEVLGSISGIVVDSETNEILENVSITTNPASSAITTDNSGSFEINAIPVGNYSIVAKKAGYRTETVNILVSRDKVSNVRILMQEGSATNRAPDKPVLSSPANQADNQPIAVPLIWTGSDPDNSDSLVFDVEIFESGNLNRRTIATDLADTTIIADGLKYNTVYYWQVTARDLNNEVTKSDIWSFRTIPMPNFEFLYTKRINGNYEIFAADTGAAVRLTNSSYHELQPVLSPLRDKIAFTSDEFVQSHIFTMNRDGSNKRQVTVSTPVTGYHNDGIGFAWSPDGSQLIYANYDRIYKVNRNGTGLHQIATAPANRHFRQLDWTDRGTKIVAQTIGSNIYDSEFYVMDASGNNMQLFIGNLPGRLESPSFSVTGQEILFARDVAGFDAINGRQLDSHIFIIKTDSSSIVDISQHKPAGFNDTNPKYSPNGAQVIFEHSNNAMGSKKEIWIMDIDGNNRQKLFEEGEMPDWK